jgi:predicted dehydrogenase
MMGMRTILNGAYNRFMLKAERGNVGIALLGAGGWGGANAIAIMRSRRFSILGVYDCRLEIAQAFGKRYKVKVYETAEALLSNPSVHAVCITVPNPFHKEFVFQAINAGKHVFVEKPLASSPDDCREIKNIARSRSLVLQVGHQMRREPVFREICRIIKHEELGCPFYAHAFYTLDRRNRIDWRQNVQACPGGSMEQLGVHLIDTFAYLFGKPIRSQGWSRKPESETDNSDWKSLVLTFQDNIQASLCTSFSVPNFFQVQIFLRDGSLVTNGIHLTVMSLSGKSRTYRPTGPASGVSQFVEFATCIATGGEPETGAEEAETAMRAMQAMFSDTGSIAS